MIHVVGLGPGGADLVTAGTLDVIASTRHRYLRTDWHPAASVVTDAVTFDHVYESSDTFEQVYRTIVDELVTAAGDAAAAGDVVLYAVPGSPVVAEHTVELLLLDPRVEVVVHPALSFLDLTWVRLGIDPAEHGVRVVDGHRYATEGAGERGPLLVAQCNDRDVLSDIKLSVDDPGDATVVILQRLGLDDEVILEVPWSEMDRVVEPDHLTSLWIPSVPPSAAARVGRLDDVMHRLRDEDPWKAEQTHDSLKKYLLEESYEVLEAIDAYDPDTGEGVDELCSELGDLLYQVVFHSTIAEEAGWFSLGDVADAIHDKLVRRHGHVFDPDRGDDPTPTVDELVTDWEHDKRAELGRESVFDGIPSALPALARALKVVRKTAAIGADSAATAPPGDAAAQIGEELFALVEAAQRAGVDPEDALRRATDRRMAHVRQHEAGGPGT
ncbi:MAG: SAM-dependent methyltransferase [Actinomycetota bacterium]|nr:SAM-dependent methyltransferase [Actinomycetota bacterium]